MKKYRTLLNICLGSAMLLGLTACEDWLEIEPKDRFSDITVWGSEENATMFLNDIYNQFPHLNNETQCFDQYSDNSYVGAEWMNARTTIYTAALSPTSWLAGPWDIIRWKIADGPDGVMNRPVGGMKIEDTDGDGVWEYNYHEVCPRTFVERMYYQPIPQYVLDRNPVIRQQNGGEDGWVNGQNPGY